MSEIPKEQRYYLLAVAANGAIGIVSKGANPRELEKQAREKPPGTYAVVRLLVALTTVKETVPKVTVTEIVSIG